MPLAMPSQSGTLMPKRELKLKRSTDWQQDRKVFKCLSLKTAGHKSHLITGEHSESIMCLPELLMDVMITKGDTVKLSVITAALCHFYSVSCDVMFSCHVIGLLNKDVANIEQNGLDCVAKVRSELRVMAKEEESNFDVSLNHV